MKAERQDGPGAAVRIRVMKRDRFRCTYCGVPGTDAELEIDHIIPVSKGGSHHISNLTTACRACNQKKSNGDLEVTDNGHAAAERSPLMGMWLHTFNDDGSYHWQAKVVAVDGDVVLIQLFSWLDGCQTNIEKVTKEFVYSSKCRLYANREDFMDAYDKELLRRYPNTFQSWRVYEKLRQG